METFSIYEVAYSARKNGASGIFYPVIRRVTARSRDEAREQAFRVLHLDGYETNHPISIEKTEETVQLPSDVE